VIRPHSLKLLPTNKKALGLFIALLCATLVTMVVYSRAERYQGVVGLVSVAAICAAVLVYTKYVSPVYYYDITDDSEGVWVFVVRQVTGKRVSTLCRVSLHEIVSVTREDKTARAEHKTPFGTRKYVYTPTLLPDVSYRLSVSSAYEKSEIVIEAPEEYMSLLSAYIEEAKSTYIEADE
jgi:hypothetical protein